MVGSKAGVPLLTERMSLIQVESDLSFCVVVLSPMHLPLVHRRP